MHSYFDVSGYSVGIFNRDWMKYGPQTYLWEPHLLAADVVYTPDFVAKHIVKYLKPSGKCLDPCKGDGAFYQYLPPGSDYCEIRDGKDFMSYTGNIDWVIGNPPYSIFENFLRQAFYISQNVSYLVPTNKIFQRQIIMRLINEYGGIKSMIIYGSGSIIGFPFGFSVGNFHFQKDYKGKCEIVMGISSITNESKIKNQTKMEL